MTASKRKIIRSNIAKALLNNTSAYDRVYESRTRKVPVEALPAILIYTREETSEIFSVSPRELKRVLSVAIEIAARADENLDDQLDDIAQEVEQILSEHQTLSDEVQDIVLSRTEIMYTAEGDSQHGSCVLTYEVTYYTEDVSRGVAGRGVPPENVLTPFETAHISYVVPPAETVSAVDEVEPQQ